MHRDVKPQNVMVSEVDRCIKFIDLGAAADLRIGTNYIPNEFLLDPRYAPPQQYIMSTQTPQCVTTFHSKVPVLATPGPLQLFKDRGQASSIAVKPP